MSAEDKKKRMLTTLRNLEARVKQAVDDVENDRLFIDKNALCLDGYRGEAVAFRLGEFMICESPR